jgi:hypothetical protein
MEGHIHRITRVVESNAIVMVEKLNQVAVNVGIENG